MSWNKLAPIAATTGKPMASASIVVLKDKVPRISLILAASLKDEFGSPTRADVHAGTGEHEGSVLVEFHDEGAFPVGNFVHGGARIYLPVPEGLPQHAAANAPCRLGAKLLPATPRDAGAPAHDSVVIHLPVEAWRASAAAPRPPSGGSAVRPPSHLPPPVVRAPGAKPEDDGLVDVVEYLGRKGLKVSRLAGGRFMLDGATLFLAEVLGRVNKHRADAKLPALVAAQVK